MRIRVGKGPDGQGAWFTRPARLIEARSPDELRPALAALDAARADGAWLAGYVTYEAGYALEPVLAPLMPKDRALPLLRFGVYDAPEPGDLPAPGGGLGDLVPRWDAPRHAAAFDRLHRYIGAGDTYQVNLTFPIDAAATGDPAALYAALAQGQAVGHGALVLQQDGPDILSRSPELFFRTDGAGLIETMPMKGTQPRGDTAEEDALRKAWLATDSKNRAENLMIVDLLRNDLSRIAEMGSVQVPELFAVQSYATVHQMVSRVQGRLRPGVGLAGIFEALFPCGSITGAPKVRAMEIIAELEDGPRDIYCGTIGWAAPNGRSSFNVAIRTVLADGARARLNVGGGIVWDSTAASEYEEALWKSRFAQISPPT